MARKQRVQKTNAMRELERGGVAYEAIEFDEPDPTGVSDLGVRIANMLGYDLAQGFKTLVCVAPHGGHVVCCIPSGDELDLKKAAAAAGEKSLTLRHVRDLEPHDRLRARRLLARGHEKAVPHAHRRDGPAV